jgi:DNA-binding HxlR family transcriptional regulator
MGMQTVLTTGEAGLRANNCGETRTLLEHVTSKWGVLVLLTLTEGTQRWSDLKRRIEGVSEKMLIQTLQTLERDGLVVRTAHPVVPPHVDYALSPAGQDAAELLAPLVSWVAERVDSTVSVVE